MTRKFLLTIVMTLGCLAGMAQNYTIYSATRGVEVETGGKTVAAKVGMPLKVNDILIIPKQGSVAVHDKNSGDIYTSVSTGRVSVTQMKIEATRTATSKAGNILSGVNARFGSRNGNSGARVYVEKGMVTRSLKVYDPDGDSVEMEPSMLARYIASRLAVHESDEMPVNIDFGPKGEGGKYFRLENTSEYPVYFNVVRLKDNEIEISALGQPNGTYVVLPGQAIQREHLSALPVDEAHIIVLTPCQYDLDTVISQINIHLGSGNPVTADDTSACVLFMD